VYAESIVFGGETTLLGEGVTSYRLTNVGEYTVNFAAKDYDGNIARSSFKIVTTDTVAPVIQAQKTAIAWAKDGKVGLPKANVVDNASYALTVSVKDSAGSEVAVADNKITAGVGVYTVTYTAKDVSNNQSSVETKLIVQENGVSTNSPTQVKTECGTRTACVSTMVCVYTIPQANCPCNIRKALR
jgi:hypothetical protein